MINILHHIDMYTDNKRPHIPTVITVEAVGVCAGVAEEVSAGSQ